LTLVVPSVPPQTIICPPVLFHAAVCNFLAEGALVVEVASHTSVPGLYLPPVLSAPAVPWPPQITM
jgi:hypothetical protein